MGERPVTNCQISKVRVALPWLVPVLFYPLTLVMPAIINFAFGTREPGIVIIANEVDAISRPGRSVRMPGSAKIILRNCLRTERPT
ncbi:hypothetical protein LQK84_03915 [Rhizobium sp. C4]|nr:hypothetical protein [Rhizobium sp. C4]